MHIRVEDLDRTLEHEKEIYAALAPLEEQCAPRDRLFGPIASNPLRHLFAEAREGLSLPGVRIGGIKL